MTIIDIFPFLHRKFNYCRLPGITFIFCLTVLSAAGQHEINHKKYDCGFYVKNYRVLTQDYYSYREPLGCKKHETIASIGAGNGQFEAEISAFTDSIDWYLEDIDSSCLNRQNFNRILKYFTKLKKGPVSGNFHLVIGEENDTHLPGHLFDRIVMVNVYHELDNPGPLLHHVLKLLKPRGELVISEVMARQPGELHADCGKPRLEEHYFLGMMQVFGYKLVEEILVEPQSRLKMFFFRAATD